MISKYMDSQECSNHLRVSPDTLKFWRWARRHEKQGLQYGPPFVAAGKKILYEVDAVDQWVHQTHFAKGKEDSHE